MKRTLIAVLFGALAFYGCSSDSGGGAAGSGGDAGSGGTAGSGGGGAAGSGGSAGSGGEGGAGGMGGMIPGLEYQQNFEDLDSTAIDALSDDPNDDWGAGWLVFGNVFEADGTTFLYNYIPPCPCPAPNSTADTVPDAFSAIASDEGGDTQGDQQLSVFNDYENGDHTNGSNNRIEAIVFRERSFVAEDEGKTLTFSFDAKKGNLGGATTAMAFIKTLDPDAGFAETNLIPQDTTNISTEWMRYSVELEITAELVGQIVQIGFSNTASNSDPSGILYDNIVVAVD